MSAQLQTHPTPNMNDAMALVAAIDQALSRLSEAGLTAPHQACDGEEATLVGSAAAMAPNDWIFSGRQVNAAALWRGLDAELIFSHALRGDAAPDIGALKVVTVAAGPATRLPHAAGLAWAARKDGVVALCELGDGAVSDGDFHVGLNFAGVLGAPVVFVVRTEGTIPVAERAEGYGINSLQIDGADAEAVRQAVEQSATYARNGNGPTLIAARVTRGRTVVSKGAISGYEASVARALAAAEKKGRH